MPPLRAALLIAAAAAAPGCTSSFHGAAEPLPPDPVVDGAAAAGKGCVFVFFLNDPDPLDAGDLVGCRKWLNAQGYVKTYSGYPCHRSWFAERVRTIHHHCPAARFVLIGYAKGADAARLLALDVAATGVTPDLLVYLEPKKLTPGPPPPAWKVLTIRGSSDFGTRDLEASGQRLVIPDVHASDVPTHPMTRDAFLRELNFIAVTVPVFRLQPTAVPLTDPIPPPRDVLPAPAAVPPEWKFLDVPLPAVPIAPAPDDRPKSRTG